MTTFVHDPQASLRYRWNWSAWLEEDDTITGTPTITVSPSDALTVGTAAVVDGKVTVRVSGGTAGQNVELTCHIQTAQGDAEDRTMTLKVRQR